MKRFLLTLISTCVLVDCSMAESKLYDLNFTSINGKNVAMEDFKDKVVLIVNTASKCGFTSQYEGLERLWDANKDKGLVVIAFPCNQFGGQEPWEAQKIREFCKAKFSTSFPMSEKVDVNGENAHPIFKFLKKQAPGILGSKDIKWNFTKFLVSKDGTEVKRYSPTTKPSLISKDIKNKL